jgi:transcriptional regulator with XRE-family HTH domain
MSNEIAGIIIEKRKALHMTQRDLAEKLNVSDQTVSR